MSFRILYEPAEDWERFVMQQGGSPFWRLVWSRVLQVGLGGQPLWFVLKDGTEIVGGMAGVLLNHGGIRLLYCSIPYGGYLGDQVRFDLFMDAFCTETGFADIISLSPYDGEPVLDYAGRFTASTEIATRLDLRGRCFRDVQDDFPASVRQSLNKGERLGLKVECRRDLKSFLIAHRLYRQTMRRNRAIIRYPERWFAALHDGLAATGVACVYLVFSGDLPISATVVVASGRGKHLLHSGSSPEHLSLRANDLVVCRIVRDAAREGDEYVDFMFSDPADTSLIGWKEKFGGQSLPLSKYRRINSPVRHALWQGAKKLAPLFGRFGARQR